MACIAVSIKILICMVLAVIVVKLGMDQHKVEWHSRRLPQPERCSDIVLGPEVRSDWPNWQGFADELTMEVQQADEEQGYDVIFYGDSITEQWRGSAVGADYPSLQQTKSIFEASFNSEYRSHVLAIAGDQIGHLWWRLLNGQIPTKHHPKAVVILIGTNDLTADDCKATEEASIVAAQEVASRTQEILMDIRERLPQTEIIMLGILPRDAHVLSGPPAYEWPNRMTKAVAVANEELQKMAEKNEKVHFLDCGAPFILPEGGLDSSILPDALHPNAGGMELLAGCLKPQLDILVSYTNSPVQASAGP